MLTRLRKSFSWRYRRFMQRQGYVIITVICAAVIAGSAAWTQQAGFRHMEAEPSPDAASAAELWQQSLQSAATPVPGPTAAPSLWQSPVRRVRIAMGYDPDRLVPSGIATLWRVHDAVDFSADPGDRVTAIRDGIVTQVTDTSVVITHDGGWVSEYEGLATTGDLQEGQFVEAGDVIGIAGGSAHGQSDSVHLRVTLNGEPADPVALLELGLDEE